MKKARMRLRTAENHKTHHFSTFRAGLYIGLAVPAVVDGLVKCQSCLLSSDINSVIVEV